LKENIALGRSDASIDDIIAAAKAAHIHERIMALPRGYDSVIGDDALLSDGEAQRVSIARVILQNTPILIMDEATSAADPEIETEIQSALSDLVVGRTVVIIAHRLQTVQHADNILVIDHGRIIQSGTHAQLANVPRAYADMWQAQQSDKGAQASAASSAETSIAASAASATDAANATTAISKEDRS
jgi:ATP-binding cassette subfamily B protein